MSRKLVSIIIPAFNRAHLIGETIDSVLEQTYTHWECIIVDDGSTDNTAEVLNKYLDKDNRFKYFQRPEHKIKGANACRNYGVEKANGDYIIFLDSDDLLVANCLENRVAHFMVNQEYDMLVFSMGHFESSDNCYIDEGRSVVNLPLEETIVEFVLGKKIPWNVTRPIYKREFLYRKIEFNEIIQNFQDDEFHIRVLADLKAKYISLDVTDSFYRYDEKSINKYKNYNGYQNICDSLYEYYTTVFRVFDEGKKKQFRSRLILKFIKLIRAYAFPNIDLVNLKKTFLLFKKHLGLTNKEMFLINLMLYLNYYYYNKKGYYKLTKFLIKKIE